MGQITTETIACIRRAVDAGQAPPLTLWEFRQLAFLAEKQITKASPLTYVQRRALIDHAGDITDGLNQDDFADEIIKLVEAHHGVATKQAEAPTASNAGEHELDSMPIKLLRELSNDALGGYINHLRNHARERLNAVHELAEAQRACKELRAALAQAPEQVAQDKIDAERWRELKRNRSFRVDRYYRGNWQKPDNFQDVIEAVDAARTSGEANHG